MLKKAVRATTLMATGVGYITLAAIIIYLISTGASGIVSAFGEGVKLWAAVVTSMALIFTVCYLTVSEVEGLSEDRKKSPEAAPPLPDDRWDGLPER